MASVKTPESINALLDTLGEERPKISKAKIETYCAKAGRPPTNAKKLAQTLKNM